MTDTTTTQNLSESELKTIAGLAEMVIPASTDYDLPGAGDPAIVAEIVVDAERHMDRLRQALAYLDTIAQDRFGKRFTELSAVQRGEVVTSFRQNHTGAANLIANLTMQAYYRDDRVMLSLGMEPRPPHPLGHVVEQGDWSLLDPVRQRDAFYRKID